MAAGTTFLVGAIVGGGAKWAYDKWQAREEKPDLSLTAVREKTAAWGQSVSNFVRRRKDDAEETAAAEAEDAVEPNPA
ncbi:MAG: hypothetical protein AAF614_32440 [Chloroflexota bacterium]